APRAGSSGGGKIPIVPCLPPREGEKGAPGGKPGQDRNLAATRRRPLSRPTDRPYAVSYPRARHIAHHEMGRAEPESNETLEYPDSARTRARTGRSARAAHAW